MTTNRPKVLLALTLFIFVGLRTFASTWTVPAHTLGGSSTDVVQSLARDSAGNVYVTGYTQSFGAGGQDVLILKYSSGGNFLWSKTWGGSGNEFGNSIKVGPDGLLYITGYTSSFGAGWYDLFLLQLDTDGNLKWGTTWGGRSFDGGSDLGFDATGNIYVVGESYSTSPCCSAVLLKFSPNGALLRSTFYKGPANYDSGYSLGVDSAFNVIVTGISWDYSYSPLHNSLLILKFDPNGNLLWQENYATPFPAQDESWAFHAVKTDHANNIYIAGRHSASCLNANFSLCDFDAMLLKLNANGAYQWAKTWGETGAYDTAGSVALEADGTILLAAMENQYGYNNGAPQLSLLSYQSNGKLLSAIGWSKGTIQQASPAGMIVDAVDNPYLASSALNNSGEWEFTTANPGSLSNQLIYNASSTGTPAETTTSLTTATVSQAGGVQNTGGGGPDAFVMQKLRR
jgi:hypothetical protein